MSKNQEYVRHIISPGIVAAIRLLLSYDDFNFRFESFRHYFAEPQNCPFNCERCERRSEYPTYRDQARNMVESDESDEDDLFHFRANGVNDSDLPSDRKEE